MTEPSAFRPVFDEDSDNVVSAVNRNGRSEAEEFIAALPLRFQARYQRYFEWLRDGHRIKSPENQRHLKSVPEKGLTVEELKVDKYRLYVIRDGARWCATHGRKKPNDNRVPTEIGLALAIYEDCKDRERRE